MACDENSKCICFSFEFFFFAGAALRCPIVPSTRWTPVNRIAVIRSILSGFIFEMLSPWLCIKTTDRWCRFILQPLSKTIHIYSTTTLNTLMAESYWTGTAVDATAASVTWKKQRKTNNNNRKFIFSSGVLCDLKRVICVVVVLVCFYVHVASFDNILCQLPAETICIWWLKAFLFCTNVFTGSPPPEPSACKLFVTVHLIARTHTHTKWMIEKEWEEGGGEEENASHSSFGLDATAMPFHYL